MHVQAQQTYQDAIAAGQSAFLLEESDAAGDVFECYVGNLPPHTDAEICFAYVTELGIEARDGAAKFVYPAVLGARYQPTGKVGGVGHLLGDQCSRGRCRVFLFLFLKEHFLSFSHSSVTNDSLLKDSNV